MLSFCTAFIISVIAFTLTNEFEQCISNLQKGIKMNHLSNELFIKTFDRFYELAHIVHKVDYCHWHKSNKVLSSCLWGIVLFINRRSERTIVVFTINYICNCSYYSDPTSYSFTQQGKVHA